jgi:hypothetical protein
VECITAGRKLIEELKGNGDFLLQINAK